MRPPATPLSTLCPVMLRWLFAACFGLGIVRAAEGAVTFNRDVAPIIFAHCTGCHRPGQSGPFPLLNFETTRKHSKQIVEVTGRRFMPPWLPESAPGEFRGDRRLSSREIETFRRWEEQGAPEGNPADLPPAPQWSDEWQLGRPDLILEMPKPYSLAAEGRDVYRNFVLPNTLAEPRHIRAVEFRPENPRVVHHAFIKVDSSGRLRERDGVDGATGFDGMTTPEGVRMPKGYFLSWQPGKVASAEPPGYGWTLAPGQDLLLQAHLRPSGKPEQLRARVGLYFTDIPPTNIALALPLNSLGFDLAPGAGGQIVVDHLTLPAPVEVLGILPHAHYLGRLLEGFADLPDGTTRRLLRIPDWDFNWQGDYRYTTPVALPAGTALRMRFEYDNSAENPRNPNHPPREVRYGPQSSDEMAELWLQVRVGSTNDLARLEAANNDRQLDRDAELYRLELSKNPRDAQARTKLGRYLWTRRKPTEALEAFAAAAEDDPAYDRPHYYLGLMHRQANRLDQARTEFETATRLNPRNASAFSNLGIVLASLGQLDEAEAALRKATILDPSDSLARRVFDEFQRARRKAPEQR